MRSAPLTVSTRRRGLRAGVCAAALLALVLAPTPAFAKGPVPMAGVSLQEAWPGVTFDSPTCCTTDGSTAMFICEQRGLVLRIEKYRGAGPVPAPAVFLDLRAKVENKMQGGLLSVAFHPQYASNKRVFVSYLAKGPDATNRFMLKVAEFQGVGTSCDPASERPVLNIPHRRAIHHGGGLGFGPDGMLYVGIGDGGGKPKPGQGATFPSQQAGNPFGKVLRVDVTAPGQPKAPADNPWATMTGYASLVFGYGFRNPWQFDWDAQGRLWTAEPGTKGPGSREWVTEVRRGGNHGWPYYEGDRVLPGMNPPAAQQAKMVMPALVYESSETAGAAVAGKFYRGSRVPALSEKLVFLDHMRGDVYAVDVSSGKGTGWSLVGKVPSTSCVGRDDAGELYIVSFGKGKIFTIVPAS